MPNIANVNFDVPAEEIVGYIESLPPGLPQEVLRALFLGGEGRCAIAKRLGRKPRTVTEIARKALLPLVTQ